MASTPVQPEDVQGDSRWLDQHARFVNEARESEPDILFIGDSLIQHLVTKK